MDSRTPTVSVIVPIYNVEKYLGECLESVLAQTLSSIEIICVNDGSTDGSLGIIQEYESRDSRIVVIDKPNGGYGHAVNRGLDIARGEWLSIVEPDDKIDSRMYADLTALGSSSYGDGPIDIVKGSYWLYFDFEGRDSYVERPNLMNCMPQGVCELDLWQDPEMLRHHPSIWSAIYRREFVEKNGIRMIEPKGAGWADNPWLFETTLRAGRIMWTPAPYYYYRQTNPDASSNLKDFHLPFDRLRDIRAIYEKLGVTNKGLLTVLYHRSFNYICTSLLEEFRFPENDPEMQRLIREVFESFDEDILMDKKNGIPKKHKNYYLDFMGKLLAQVKPMRRSENPRISFVIPMLDDRRGLWETLDSILNQQYGNFEVICVDCESSDRSMQIVSDLAQIDRRFSIHSVGPSLSEGFNLGIQIACGEYVAFMRPGAAFEDWSVLRTITERLDELGFNADMVVFRTEFPASRLVPRNEKLRAVGLSTEGVEGDVALAGFPDIYSRFFRRGFLHEAGICFLDDRDDHGQAFCVSSAACAKSAAFIAAKSLKTDTRKTLDRDLFHSEDDLIQYMLGKYACIAEAAARLGTRIAWMLARSVIVCHMAIDISFIGRNRSGRRYFEALRDVYMNDYGIRSASMADYSNYLDMGVLEEAFSLDFEDYASNLLMRQQVSLIDLTWQRDQAKRAANRIKRSGSYIVGKRLSGVMKDVVSTDMKRNFVYKAMQSTENSKG